MLMFEDYVLKVKTAIGKAGSIYPKNKDQMDFAKEWFELGQASRLEQVATLYDQIELLKKQINSLRKT